MVAVNHSHERRIGGIEYAADVDAVLRAILPWHLLSDPIMVGMQSMRGSEDEVRE